MDKKMLFILLVCLILISGCKSATKTESQTVEKTADLTQKAVVGTTPGITQMELILDDSNTMAQEIDGKVKIDVAKDALSKIIDELVLKDNLEAALRIYGNRNMECTDSAVEVPMGKINAVAMKAKFMNLKPLGYTPIGYSLMESVKDFKKDINGEKIIVLITDGLESCDHDPCEVSKSLKEAGIITQLQVVGIGMKEEELAALKCIAEPFGNKVYGVKNAAEFMDAMQNIVKKSLIDTGINVSVIGVDGKPLSASKLCAYVAGKDDKEVLCAGTFTESFFFRLKPGKYDVLAVSAATSAKAWLNNIEVQDKEVVQKTVSFAQGFFNVSVIGADGTPLSSKNLCVYPSGETKKSTACAGTFTDKYQFKLTPGVYDLHVASFGTSEEKWFKGITIKATETVMQTVSFDQGTLVATVTDSNGAKKNPEYTICAYVKGETNKEVACAGTFTNTYKFTLKPGIYDLKAKNYKTQDIKWANGVKVEAAKNTDQNIVY